MADSSIFPLTGALTGALTGDREKRSKNLARAQLHSFGILLRKRIQESAVLEKQLHNLSQSRAARSLSKTIEAVKTDNFGI